MPIDSMIAASIVVALFVAFAALLAWGDRQTRAERASGAQDRKRRPF